MTEPKRCACCGHPTDNKNDLGIGRCCTHGPAFDPLGDRISGGHDRTDEGTYYTEEWSA